MRATLTALACSLILGLSIGLGSSLADKPAQTSRIIFVRDSKANSRLQTIDFNLGYICQALSQDPKRCF